MILSHLIISNIYIYISYTLHLMILHKTILILATNGLSNPELLGDSLGP